MAHDITPAQEDVLKAMGSGSMLKLTPDGVHLLVAPNGTTSKVLAATVRALERGGVVHNTKKADRHGNQLYALAEHQETVGRKPSRWPFMVSAHNWSKP